MDKQTAIDLLDNLLGMVEDNHESDYDAAIKMGIDALKEKTQLSKEDATKDATFDCISRRAVIDELNVLCQEHRYRIPGKRETYSEYNEAWQDALDRAEGVIFNLPSVQPQSKREWYQKGYEAGQKSVQPQRMGKWIDKDGGIATCSECGDRWGVWSVMNYCPNCGADMRGTE